VRILKNQEAATQMVILKYRSRHEGEGKNASNAALGQGLLVVRLPKLTPGGYKNPDVGGT
jgi:hypothetical protein